ncbi:hypothetical protein HKD37_17G047807 [Glycine soja]
MMLYIITISTGVILMRRTFAVWRCRRPLMLAKNYMLAWNLIIKMPSKNAVKQYVMKVYQSFKVVESKSNKYVVCCLNKNAKCPGPFYMRAILSKKTDTWKVTQWSGPHTCLNMIMTQDHEKLDSDLIATCVVGTYFMFILCSFFVNCHLNFVMLLTCMIREDPSIKISLIQERINSEFAYKVSYKKAWLAKQKAIAIEYGDWDESYVKLSSWLTHMQNHSPGSYFQVLHDDFIDRNTVSRKHRQFHRVFFTFGQCKEALKYCKPIIQVDGTHLYGKYRGTLLMATSQDGNGGVLPLAFAVVEGETLTAWSWFLAHLCEHVIDKNDICLISDRHASIKSAVANEALGCQPPHGYHVYCVRHIANNFNQKFNNAKQKEMLKKLACGYVSLNYYQYIDVVYTNEHIVKAYSAQWWPLGNEAVIPPSNDAWTLIPDPTTIRAKGRPKSTRIRNEMDWVEPSEHRQKYSRCGAEGHNRRHCPMQSERGSCSTH